MAVLAVIEFLLVSLFISYCYSEVLEEGCADTRTVTTTVPLKVISVYQTGHLYSPGFLQNKDYPDNLLCNYQLQVPEGKHLRIHFNVLDIDVTDGCGADSLQIHDFNSLGQGQLQTILCGNQIPYDYVSQSYAIQFVFRSDAFAGRRGFNITYTPQDTTNVCELGQKQCKNRKCVQQSSVCDGNDDCGDGTDEEKCPGRILPTTECGRPEVDHEVFSNLDRIVGGKEVVNGSWPWMASLQVKLIEPNGHTCGGSLINAQWILTAAHCFPDTILRYPSGWRIHLGSHNKFQKDPYEQVRYAERIVIFDDISPAKFERDGEYDIVNDIALIKLNAPVKLNKYVKPICLPDPRIQLNITSNCYATGWGATRGSGSSHALKQAYHPVQPDILCTRRVGNSFKSQTMICAGSMAPLNGVCHGDSGGPLVCESSKGKWSIVGVASFVTDGTGEGVGLCGLQGRPSVFNRVSVKNAYIQRMINKYS